MGALIYSPGVKVYIQTAEHGTLDVSNDLIDGTLVRRVDGVSTFNFSMNNPRRKYDGVFTPNDRIIVQMRRLRWLQVFTGLLNTVPLIQAWPRPVAMSASCSLKRLQYWYWDPDLADTQNMVMQAMGGAQTRKKTGAQNQATGADGGVTNGVLTILEKVVGWQPSKVHIGEIPEDWMLIAEKVAQAASKSVTEGAAYAKDVFSKVAGEAPGAGGVAGGAGAGTGAVGSAEGVLSAGEYGGVSLGKDQVRNAEIIFDVGNQMSLSAWDIQVALATAMQESTLKNIDYGDRDSVGLFQQRPSQGWGTVAEIMDPKYASKKFYQALKQVGGRDSMALWEVAYKVQRCAAEYAKEYQKWSAMAGALVEKIKTGLAKQMTTAGNGTASSVNFVNVSKALVKKYAIPYRQGTRTRSFLMKEPPAYLDCSSFVMAIYYRVGGRKDIPQTSATQAAWCDRISTAEALRTPGALVFVSNNGEASGVHHVEVSLGDGRTVGAHRPGKAASIASGGNRWSFGGLMPGITYMANAAARTSTQETSTASAPSAAKQQIVWPVKKNRVTTKYRQPGSWAAGYHTGADFGEARGGDAIVASLPGTVTHAGTDGAYGEQVTVKTGKFRMMYCHMTAGSITVSVGQQVKAGEKLGEVGNTGRVFGANGGYHLHLEARKSPYGYGDDVDPIALVRGGVDASQVAAGGSASGGGNFSVQQVEGHILGLFVDKNNQPYELVSQFRDHPDASKLSTYDPADPIDKLFGSTPWVPVYNLNSSTNLMAESLQGAYALLNDQPLLPYIANMLSSTMRSYCSAPNGDLIAWFPDYYGLWGTAGILQLKPIEIIDLSVMWSDDSFVTHQYVSKGNWTSFNLERGTAFTQFDPTVASGQGIANIDMPSILEVLFGIPSENHSQFARWVYDRFGARPDNQEVHGLSGPKAALFAAIYTFMRQWAYQYNANVPLTFMPEAWPGMLLQVEKYDFQAYITTVTHSFAFGEGGGFSTTVNLAAPAYLPSEDVTDRNHVLIGLPLAGEYTARKDFTRPSRRSASEQTVLEPVDLSSRNHNQNSQQGGV